jgi:hypothetical protein
MIDYQIEVGSRVVLDTATTLMLGDVQIYVRYGDEGKVLRGHDDNKLGLDDAHKLWLVELTVGNHLDPYTVHAWFRANKLGLIV